MLCFLVARICGLKKTAIGINYIPRERVSVHAEIDALKYAKKKLSYSKGKVNLLVVRYTKTGIIGESRPCYHCILHLQKYQTKIAYIYYSTADGRIVRENLMNMLKSHKTYVSHGKRRRLN